MPLYPDSVHNMYSIVPAKRNADGEIIGPATHPFVAQPARPPIAKLPSDLIVEIALHLDSWNDYCAFTHASGRIGTICENYRLVIRKNFIQKDFPYASAHFAWLPQPLSLRGLECIR